MNWPEACTRIAYIAASTGNFLPFMVGAILIIICLKLNSVDLKVVVLEIAHSAWFSIGGWLTAGLAVFVCIRIIRWKDRFHTDEITRMAEVKRQAMQQHFALELPSTNQKE